MASIAVGIGLDGLSRASVSGPNNLKQGSRMFLFLQKSQGNHLDENTHYTSASPLTQELPCRYASDTAHIAEFPSSHVGCSPSHAVFQRRFWSYWINFPSPENVIYLFLCSTIA